MSFFEQTTIVTAGAVVSATNPLPVSGSFSVSGGNAAASTTGSAVPAQGSYTAFNSGGNLTGVSATNPMPVTGSFSITGGNAAASTTGVAVPAQAGYTGFYSGGNLVGVSATNAFPVLVTTPITGTVVSTIAGGVVVSGVLGSTQGTSPWVTTATLQGTSAVAGVLGSTQGTSPWVTTATVQGTAAVQGAVAATQSGNWTMRNVGNAGAIFDALITATTAPANGIVTLAVVNTAAPSASNGQSIAAQADYQGNLFTRPFRRSGMVVNSIAVSNTTTATTMLPAQAAGIYTDLCQLIVTATPAGTTSTTFTITVSDGTTNYIYDMVTGNANTMPGTIINIDYNPPFPASVAATTWTAKLSVANVVVHISAAAVLQHQS